MTRRVLVAAIGRPLIDAGHITANFLSYTLSGAHSHVNRHVREASFSLITAIIEACGDLHESGALVARFVPVLAAGLQVIMSASRTDVYVHRCSSVPGS